MISRTDEAVSAFYATLGQRITQARKDAGLTQDALSRAVGLSRSSIANVENGVQQTPLHTLLAICQATGVTLTALIDGTDASGAVQASVTARQAKATAEAAQRVEAARRRVSALGESLDELALWLGGGEPS